MFIGYVDMVCQRGLLTGCVSIRCIEKGVYVLKGCVCIDSACVLIGFMYQHRSRT